MPGIAGMRGVTPVARTISSNPPACSSLAVTRPVERQLHSGLIDAATEIAQRFFELFLAGNALGDVKLAADLGARPRTGSRHGRARRRPWRR